jgi:gliding motility-associated-like protein
MCLGFAKIDLSRVFFLILFSIIVNQAFAQIVDPFSIRYQNQQKGGIRLLSNVSVSCSNCAATTSQIPPAGNGINNNFNMTFVDTDNTTATYMSSSDSLNLPNCSEVLWAGLYWGARVGGNGQMASTVTNYAVRNQVRIRVNNGTYTTLTADELLDNNVGFDSYHCFKNITPLVQAVGTNARFTIGNLVTRTGTSNMFGGWTIVVVYKNVFESMRNLTVFDGLANVSSGNTVTIPISGFLTPPTGPVSFELGVVSHDGDRGQTGDQLQFNGVGTTFVNVSDAVHNTNDVFNSTIARNGILTPFRIPNLNNNLGHDASVFFPNNAAFNYIGNNATSANIRITTGGETILTSVVTSVIDVYEPDLRATVSVQDLNGGLVQPGDVLEYTLVGKNIGSDISNGTFMSDTLDPRTVYLPNSISINYGPNIGPKTDAYNDDQAEYDPINRVVIARIGTGANATTGGVVVNSPTGADSTVVKFRVTVINDCLMFQCDPTLDHKAYIFGTGNISGNAYNNGGLSDLYDANGCPTVASNALLINVAGCPPAAIDYNDPLCVGENLQFTFPFSSVANYNWIGPNNFTSTVQNPSINNVSSLNAGSYTVAVSFNGLDCILDTVTAVVVNPNPTISLNTITNVNCFNASTGAISITANGNAPFTYSWTGGSSTSAPTNLPAGNYIVTVTDANTCTATANYTITQPTSLTASTNITTNFNGFSVSCFGSTNGATTSTVSGGVPPYNYSWSNGSTSPTAGNLPSGPVTLTVTDANNCSTTSSVTLTQPTDIVLNDTKVNVSCFGGSNGSIDLQVNGGVAPYSYLWSNNAVSQDLNGLTAGTYTVVVTDANGCTETRTVTITQPAAALSLTETHVNVLCFGQSTGSINVTPTGGTTPYTYSWSNNAITQDLNAIPSGNYTLLLTDANACQASITVNVSQPQAPIQLTYQASNVLCFGIPTGSIDATVTGGTTPYTYSWNSGQVAQDLNSIAPGNYILTVTDANLCTSQTPVIFITQPSALSASTIVDNVNCFGASDGGIDLSVSGGTTPYSYLWSGGQLTQDLINIPIGTYNVVVTDANGCTVNAQGTLTQPLAPISGSTVANTILCFGQLTGNIDASVSGGTVPYNYLWSSGQITQDISGQAAGNYTLTVTDNNGCNLQLSQTILQPQAPLTLSETHIDALCVGGQTGSIDLTVTGGTAPYTYLWNNGQLNQDVSGLLAGIYNCVVTDANGCISTITINIQDPSNTIVLSTNVSNVSCFNGSNGAIDVTVTGGNPGYSYLWSNQAVSQDINGVSAGNYSVNVTDILGCGAFTTATVTQPATAISSTQTIQNVLCFGQATGAIDMTIQGGVPPYSYLWSNGVLLEDLSNIPSGNYQLTVTDNVGCVYTVSVVVTQPQAPLTLTEVHTNVSCFGGANGTVNLTVSGGTGPYTYSWSNGSPTEDLNGLSAGVFTVTVTDANGCSAQLSVTITQPSNPLTLSQQTSNVLCNGGATGSIDVTVSGGTPNYQYSWSNGPLTEDLNNIVAGNYTLNVLDANGCAASITSTVTQPLVLQATSSTTPVSCFGGSNGTASANPSGGTAPYSYLWNNGLTTATINALVAGTYSCVVTDANGCTVSTSINVIQPTQLLASTTQTNILCFGNSTGSVTVAPTGGIPGYSYLWNNNAVNATISNVPVGTYTVVVTDANNCTTTVSATLTQPATAVSATLGITNNLCFGGSIGAIDATVTGGVGPYQYIWSNQAQTEDINGLIAGVYQLTATDANGCPFTTSGTVTQPNQITIPGTQVSNVSCFGFSDGFININPTGGTPAFSFLWSNNQTSEDVNGLIAGNYNLIITDANNCSNQFNFTITQPTLLVGSYSAIEPLCYGYSDGQLTGSASGGTLPYSFNWNNGVPTAINANIPAGNYTLTITDANGCVTIVPAFLDQPDQIQVSYIVSDTLGCDPLLVQFTNTSDEQFSCLWNFDDGTVMSGCDVFHLYEDPGCYDVELSVTSVLGCTNSAQYNDVVCVLPSPTAGIAVDPEYIDSSDPSTTVSNTSSGAVSYLWNMGDGSGPLTVFEPGLYTYPLYQLDEYTISLLVTAENGCTDSTDLTVFIDNDVIIYVPNAFTPDDDAYNQTFEPVIASIIDQYNLLIYNRWGEIIFESFNKNVGWDGTYNGVRVQDGTYTWQITISTNGTNKIVKYGHVSVIR